MAIDDDDLEREITAVHLRSLGFLVHRLQVQLRQRMMTAVEGSGLHGGQVVVLASLWVRLMQGSANGEDPGLTQTHLVQISGVEKSSLVLFLDGLEADGWIERRKHPTDRRAHLVYLTPSGAERFAKVGQTLYAFEQENFAPFSGTEKAALMDGLAKLLVHLENLNDKG
jgi:DNA-binding MarR family transcriptional regulator